MNIVEHNWSGKVAAKLLKGFRGCHTFVACDPDANGALAFYLRGEPVACKSIADSQFLPWMESVLMNRFVGVSRVVAVVETQFAGRNLRGTVTMARRAGQIQGALAMCSRSGVEVINVVPASWQYPTARAIGVMGKLKSADFKKAAMDANGELCAKLVPGWYGHTEEQRQGIADTIGIGQWWRNLCAGVWS